MLHAALFALSPSLFLLCIVVCIRPSGTWTGATGTQIARYVLAVALENIAWAAQLIVFWAAAGFVLGAGTWLTHLTVLTWTLAQGALAIDAILFLQAGLRLQRSLASFADALTEFADRVPWRAYLATAIAATAIFGATLNTALTQVAPPPPSVALVCLVATLLCTSLAAALRQSLPLAFAYEWSNRFITAQLSGLHRARHARKASEAADDDAHSAAQLFAPTGEVSQPIDTRYPLLRHTTAFQGEWLFTLSVAQEERPHVVFIFLESQRAADVGVLGAPHKRSVTPCLDALAREGILWSNFYANGTITSRAMTAALFGILPDFREVSMQAAHKPPALLGMPQLFAQRGYLPAYFCDGPMDWENKRDFFLRQGFPLFFGAPSIRAAYPEAPNSDWNFSDEYLMQFHADWLAEQDAKGQPTFSSLLTVTNHMPWEAPHNADMPDTDVDPQSDYGRFLRTTQYTDRCLGAYMQRMRDSGLDRKTVFFILGDHGQQVENNEVKWSGRYNDGAVRVPLVMHAPGRVQPAVIHETASQIDLLPTVMDIFNIQGTHHSMGTSLSRRNAGRSAITIHPWAPGMVCNRIGPFRFVYSFDAHKAALYDLSRDPGEHIEVTKLHAALVEGQTRAAWSIRTWVNRLHGAQTLAPPHTEAPPMTCVRVLGAPPSFPSTYEACVLHAERLCAAHAQSKLLRLEQLEMAAFNVAVHAHGLTDAQKLRLAQLYLARVHVRTMGELNRAEMALLAELDGAIIQVMATQSGPPWLHTLGLTLRRLAGIAKNSQKSTP